MLPPALETIATADPLLARLQFNLKRTLDPLVKSALANGLTFADNMACEVVTLKALTIAADKEWAGAICRKAAAQTIPATTDTVINFDTVDYDAQSSVTTGAGWKFTVPAGLSGHYRVSAAVAFSSAPSSDYLLNIFKNGVAAHRIDRRGASGFFSLAGSTALQLVAGDYISAAVYINGGSSAAIEPAACNISISLLHRTDPSPVRPTAPLAARVLGDGFVGDVAYVIPALAVEKNGGSVPTWSADWQAASSGGKKTLKLWGLPGLVPGKTYDVTLLVLGG